MFLLLYFSSWSFRYELNSNIPFISSKTNYFLYTRLGLILKGSDYMSKNEQKDIDLPLYYHVICLKSRTQKPNTIQSDIF